MATFYLDGVKYEATKKCGEGGEARVFLCKEGAVKLYHGPNDAALGGNTSQDARNRQGAALRLQTFPVKLSKFPKGLDKHIIGPKKLATNKAGNPIGYLMDSVGNADVIKKLSDPDYRTMNGIGTEQVLECFAKLYGLVTNLHDNKVVIGDNNDLNTLIDSDLQPYLIDTDSFQFADYTCSSFTQRFADPLLCDPAKSSLLLVKKHNVGSDWYAFALQLIQSVLYVSPYDGVYVPKDKSKKCVHDARPLRRITIFDKDVKYPKFAQKLIDPKTLPDDLMHQFDKILHKDERGPFPIALLGQKQKQVGAPMAIVVSRTTFHGTASYEPLFETSGVILVSAFDGKLRYLYHENDELKREDGTVILRGALLKNARYRISGNRTCIATRNRLLTWTGSDMGTSLQVDGYGVLPCYDTNSKSRFWIQGGRLIADDFNDRVRTIGSVVQNQSMFWVGEHFGFGMYFAGELQEFFVFETNGLLKDGVKVPRIKGNIFDATCVFSDKYAWFFVAAKDGNDYTHRCTLIDRTGNVVAQSETRAGDQSWMGKIRGKCPISGYLFTATDDAIMRVQPSGGGYDLKDFPDAEKFVDSNLTLLPAKTGLHLVGPKEIGLLQIS